VKRAKIANLRFHDLRHDFATKLRRRGIGLDVIRDLLGHSTLAMAQRYAHIGRDDLSAAVETLPPLAAPRFPQNTHTSKLRRRCKPTMRRANSARNGTV
jgi:integrase